MYLHIGGDVVLPRKKIVAVFDALSVDAPATREFLQTYREEGFMVSNIEGGSIKSLVLTEGRVYMSPIASATLRRRWNTSLSDDRE